MQQARIDEIAIYLNRPRKYGRTFWGTGGKQVGKELFIALGGFMGRGGGYRLSNSGKFEKFEKVEAPPKVQNWAPRLDKQLSDPVKPLEGRSFPVWSPGAKLKVILTIGVVILGAPWVAALLTAYGHWVYRFIVQ